MGKVLFVSYGGGHINIINEIIKEIIKYKNIDFKVLALTTGYNNSESIFSDKYVKKICLWKRWSILHIMWKMKNGICFKSLVNISSNKQVTINILQFKETSKIEGEINLENMIIRVMDFTTYDVGDDKE